MTTFEALRCFLLECDSLMLHCHEVACVAALADGVRMTQKAWQWQSSVSIVHPEYVVETLPDDILFGLRSVCLHSHQRY